MSWSLPIPWSPISPERYGNMQNEVNGSSKWKGKAMTEAPILGEKTYTKSEKLRAEDSAGCDGIKTSTERCRKFEAPSPLPSVFFFFYFEDPQPIIEFRNWVKNWRIDSHAFLHGFRIWLCSLCSIPSCGLPGFRPPKASLFLEARDVCSTRNLSAPLFPSLPRISGLIQMLYSCQGWSDSQRADWRRKKYSDKKFKFYFWRLHSRYLFIYPLIYIRMNT